MASRLLFEPFQIKSLEVANRVVMAPMTRSMSPGGVPDATVAAYYAARAKGGVGLIITEGTTVGRKAASGHVDVPNFHEAAALEGWRQTVEAVHAAGGKIAPQLWHLGSQRAVGTGPHPQAPSEGPSTIPDVCEAMTDEDVADTVEAFGRAAEAAQALGFDAVELHGAHGYLIDQYLWQETNQRDDQWGGDIADRTRFGAEIIRNIRARVGPEFPIIMRFSQFKQEHYAAKIAAGPAELETILGAYAEAGADAFHASQRRFWEPEFEGSSLNLAGWAKKLTGKPAITVGSIGLKGADIIEFITGADANAPVADDLSRLEARLDAGEFDLVAVGRALLGDPNWANKVREGRRSELRGFDPAALASLVVA
jgi:2,4-dienoyl-CoA reductase-like NADH-dependent reductase (Old Yellow Enzyme family)